MLSVAEALRLILQTVEPFRAEAVPLDDALGLVLAADVVSDIESPPFDKALMDGFAVRAADVPDGTGTLRIIEEVTAGRVPQKSVGAGEATRIMTGAPLPDGADAVVRIEECETDPAGQTVRIVALPFKAGANVMLRGAALQRGETVLPAGRMLRPQEIGALAELGRPTVAVRRRPWVGVLATGDELVPVHDAPGPGQIRNSNAPMLAAQVRRAGGLSVPLGIARDERGHLRERIQAGLQCDVLLLSGGVSAGKLDLVPSELAAAGVVQIFHKVNVKPGKPMWYGRFENLASKTSPQRQQGTEPPDPSLARRASTNDRSCHVFALPGNPVSSLVCFELFARPALRRLMGHEPAQPPPLRARLATDRVARGDRPTYHPSRLDWTETGPVVHPVDWLGSADLRATVEANAMAVFPAGDATSRAGDVIDVIAWD